MAGHGVDTEVHIRWNLAICADSCEEAVEGAPEEVQELSTSGAHRGCFYRHALLYQNSGEYEPLESYFLGPRLPGVCS